MREYDMDLLKFLTRRVRIKNSKSREDYIVGGIDWDTKELLVIGVGWRRPDRLELVEENKE